MKKPLTALATVLTLVFASLPAIVPVSASFTDVSSSHTYRSAIEYVQAKGIVNGYPDGTYRPEDKLERAAFAKIVMEARFPKADIDGCVVANGFYSKPLFVDVAAGVWFEKYFCLGKLKGIMSGYPDGSTKPTATIIFAEAAKILVLSHGLAVRVARSDETWFLPYLEKLAELDAVPDSILAVSDNIARGSRAITRGEMADMIYRLKSINDTLATPDGSFSISIPEDALPEGIDRNTLRISTIPADQNPIREVNGAPMVFYKLEPEGLVFKKSVRFTISTATRSNTVPMVFLVSGDDFNVLQDPAIDIDQSQQIAVLTGEIHHFSALGVAPLAFPGFTLSPSTEPHAVGSPFTITGNLTPPETLYSFRFGADELDFSPPQLQESFIELSEQRFPANPSSSGLSAEVTCSAAAPTTPVSVVTRAKISFKRLRDGVREDRSTTVTVRQSSLQQNLCKSDIPSCSEGFTGYKMVRNVNTKEKSTFCCPNDTYIDIGPNCGVPHCHYNGVPHQGCGWGEAPEAH